MCPSISLIVSAITDGERFWVRI